MVQHICCKIGAIKTDKTDPKKKKKKKGKGQCSKHYFGQHISSAYTLNLTCMSNTYVECSVYLQNKIQIYTLNYMLHGACYMNCIECKMVGHKLLTLSLCKLKTKGLNNLIKNSNLYIRHNVYGQCIYWIYTVSIIFIVYIDHSLENKLPYDLPT